MLWHHAVIIITDYYAITRCNRHWQQENTTGMTWNYQLAIIAGTRSYRYDNTIRIRKHNATWSSPVNPSRTRHMKEILIFHWNVQNTPIIRIFNEKKKYFVETLSAIGLLLAGNTRQSTKSKLCMKLVLTVLIVCETEVYIAFPFHYLCDTTAAGYFTSVFLLWLYIP